MAEHMGQVAGALARYKVMEQAGSRRAGSQLTAPELDISAFVDKKKTVCRVKPACIVAFFVRSQNRWLRDVSVAPSAEAIVQP